MMKVNLRESRKVIKPSGALMHYAAGFKYVVEPELAHVWIREGAAEDANGKVTRESLLSPEELAAEKRAAAEKAKASASKPAEKPVKTEMVYLTAEEQARQASKAKEVNAKPVVPVAPVAPASPAVAPPAPVSPKRSVSAVGGKPAGKDS